MKTAVLVAPFFQANTLRYLRALCALPGVRPAVITSDSVARLPPDVRGALAGFARVQNSLDGRQITQACHDLKRQLGPIDALLGPLEQLQVPLAEARDACDIPGMRSVQARNFRDKAQMKDVLRQAGVPCARHRLVESDADAWEFVSLVGYPIIVKPIDGLGSKGTHRIRTEADLRQALKALRPSLERPVQAEEFVTGQENTFETVTIAGQPVWHSGTHYLPGPLEVLENPWMQYCVMLPREEDLPEFTAFRDTNTLALTALGMETGLSHMEWFQRQDGTHCVSEVGARPPGVHIMPMMSLVNGTDMVEAWTRLMVLGEFKPLRRQAAAGVAFFRGQGRGGRVKAVHGLREAHEEVGRYVVDRELPRAGMAKADSYEGEGWAIVSAPDTRTVQHALKRLVSLVRVELG
jgi:hypothetical protein